MMEASTSMPKEKDVRPESKHEGVEVDMMKRRNGDEGASGQQPQNNDDDDATASSSSFGDTFSEIGTCEYDGDDEVMSDLRGDDASMPSRKKRVTSHWRKFVQPIMWRCKWAELQLRKFESMATMYDKEIEKYSQTKQLKYRSLELESGCAKCMPFSYDSQRLKLMKRKTRKRREESDTEVCMLHDNISSYLASCRLPAHGPTMDDDHTNQESSKNVGNEFRVPDELLSLDFRDGYSLEQVLWKIEVSLSQVCKMKDRLDTVMTENAGRISSTEDLILHKSNNAVSKTDFPTDMEGQSIIATFASQLMKLNTAGDVVKPENLASNEPIEQPCIASRKQSTDGILIYNRRAKKPRTDTVTVKIHPIEQLLVPKEENITNNTVPVSVSEDSSQNEQPALKIRSISKLTTPRNAKKRAARGRRRSGSNLWSRRTSG